MCSRTRIRAGTPRRSSNCSDATHDGKIRARFVAPSRARRLHRPVLNFISIAAMPTVSDKQDLCARLQTWLDDARALRETLTPGSPHAQDRMLLRAWQAERMSLTYADLLQSPRYCPATEFFLDDLYGPKHSALHEAHAGKIVGGMTRLLPHDALHVLLMAVELDVMTERLDLRLAEQLRSRQRDLKAPLMISTSAYARAYRACDNRKLRTRQIELLVRIGQEVDRVSARPMIATTLEMMRTPARLMGLGGLQAFLERGFKAFRHMEGADEFLGTIQRRERRIIAQLFAAKPRPFSTGEESADLAAQAAQAPVCTSEAVH